MCLRVCSPNAISIGSSALAGIAVVTNTQTQTLTNHATPSVANGRIYVARAMRTKHEFAPMADKRFVFAVTAATQSINQSINQSCIFRVVQVMKSLQDPLEVGNNLPGINDNVRERSLEQKCFKR